MMVNCTFPHLLRIFLTLLDKCIVEIARRDCQSEPTHRQDAGLKYSHDPPITPGGSPIPSYLDEEPCESHYLKAKEAYSSILENIGCICKVLLSLNRESCCVTPKVVSLSGDPLVTSPAGSFLAELTKASSATSQNSSTCETSCCTTGNTNTVMARMPKNNSHTIPLELHNPSTPTKGSEIDCKQKSCCSGSSNGAADPVSAPRCKDKKSSCCAPPLPIQNDDYVFEKLEATSDCCSKRVDISGTASSKQPIHNASDLGCKEKTACCSDRLNSATVVEKIEDCSGEACCSENIYIAVEDLEIESVRNHNFRAVAEKDVDLETGTSQIEHVILSVQGMTCTGCEKKLYRSLGMLPAISNIKTSLLLAQAEFDLSSSSISSDSAQTIKSIEKMTGFACTKMNNSAHELDLFVCGFASDFESQDFPHGIIDIVALGAQTIRVTYQPKLVGARDLMSDPFFASAKLAPVGTRPLIASGRAHIRLMLFKTIVSTALTIPVLVMAWAPLPDHEIKYGAASLVLATIVQIYVAGPWYISAFNALFVSKMVEMDMLVVLSTTVAYVYSIIAYGFLAAKEPLSTGSFFETSTLLVTLIMVGRLVSGYARQRAVELISFESLQPATAMIMNPETHEKQVIDARLLQYQDLFIVTPDTAIATDGTVISGVSEVDESMITGEAMLVTKKPGSSVVAGSINHSGTITVRLSRLPGENTIKTIGVMVDEAKLSKTNIQEIADRVATFFIPTIMVITILVFLIWVAVGKYIRGYGATTTCINAMTYAISALIVSCPCAIGLAVPMVLVVAGGVAAQHGFIFKTAGTIEIARNLSHVIFDKTGTLTQGSLTVEVETYPTGQGEALASMILGLTSNSKHPISSAITSHLKITGVQPKEISAITSIPGSGIEGAWKGADIRAGNPHWLGIENNPAVTEIILLGLSTFCVTVNEDLVAVFGLKDQLRIDAVQVINELKRRRIQVSIVSGDNQDSVNSIAEILGVPESHVRSRCSPADKQVYVKQMLASPKSVVMFCGDGTNDAIALAQASIGMHINGGTDIAQSAADAVLVRPALNGIIVLMDLSKAFFRRVVFNFTWSFIYNTFAILLAAGAFPNVRIPPEFAGLGEIVSVLPVIFIGMQLRWANF